MQGFPLPWEQVHCGSDWWPSSDWLQGAMWRCAGCCKWSQAARSESVLCRHLTWPWGTHTHTFILVSLVTTLICIHPLNRTQTITTKCPNVNGQHFLHYLNAICTHSINIGRLIGHCNNSFFFSTLLRRYYFLVWLWCKGWGEAKGSKVKCSHFPKLSSLQGLKLQRV